MTLMGFWEWPWQIPRKGYFMPLCSISLLRVDCIFFTTTISLSWTISKIVTSFLPPTLVYNLWKTTFSELGRRWWMENPIQSWTRLLCFNYIISKMLLSLLNLLMPKLFYLTLLSLPQPLKSLWSLCPLWKLNALSPPYPNCRNKWKWRTFMLLILLWRQRVGEGSPLGKWKGRCRKILGQAWPPY